MFKIKSLTLDALKRDKYKASTAAERQFYSSLRKVAQTAGKIVETHAEGASLRNEPAMQKALQNYSEQLTPWATRQATKMLEQVNKSNKAAYNRASKQMGKAIKVGVGQADTGKAAIALLNEQVALIKSIPLEAGLRAQNIAAENFLQGNRAIPDQSVIDDLKEQMGMSTEVATNRARLIARTETARANASFVQARAAAVGVTHYVWRTTMDGAERKSHAQMNGKIIAYDTPPTLSDGTSGHAGTFPNCRCYQDPVIPELD